MSEPGETSLRGIDHVQDLLDRLRLDREARKRGAVIVEGPTDAFTLEATLSPQRHFFPVGGRVNVLRAADRLDQQDLPGVICVADLDFDQEGMERTAQWFLVFTDNADLESMLYWSPALDRVVSEWASEPKYSDYGGIDALRRAVEDGVAAMAVLRSWNTAYKSGLDFDALDLQASIGKATLTINMVGLIDRLSAPEQVQRQAVQDALTLDPPRCPYTGDLLARGHDRLAFVTTALRSAIGGLSKQQASGGLVERSLRLAARPSDLEGTSFLARVELALDAALAA